MKEKLTSANSFDQIASAIPGIAEEIRPRRWIARIGRLLRAAREHNELGQASISEKAHVTQPYLSRLENGLLPTRGPTVELLLRCMEAADCGIEISIRSKKDGKVIGRLDSADLDSIEWAPDRKSKFDDQQPPRFILATRRPGHSHLHHDDKVSLNFEQGPRKKSAATVWFSSLDALSRHEKMSRHSAVIFTRAIEGIFHGLKGRGAPAVKEIDPSKTASNTLNLHAGDLLVLGSESELTRAMGEVESSEEG